MTKDEVLALAREVGLWEMLEGYSSEYGSLDAEEDCLPDLERFVALVAAHEREECAKVCEERKINPAAWMIDKFYNQAVEHCAAAIRSRT